MYISKSEKLEEFNKMDPDDLCSVCDYTDCGGAM